MAGGRKDERDNLEFRNTCKPKSPKIKGKVANIFGGVFKKLRVFVLYL